MKDRNGELGRRLLLAAFIVTAASAALIVAIRSWNVFYLTNLVLHPTAGLAYAALTIWALPAWFAHVPGFNRRVWVWLPLGLSLLFAASCVGAGAPSRLTFGLMAAVLMIYLALGALRLRRSVTEDLGAAILPYFSFGVWLMTLFTALCILASAQHGGVKHLFFAHRASGVIVTLLVAARIGRAALRGPEAQSARKTLVWFGAATAGVVVLIGQDRWQTDPKFDIHLSTIPIERRNPEEKALYFSDPAFQPAGIDLTASCSTLNGCHRSLLKGFLQSNHNLAYQTPHMQKNLDLMAEEVGLQNTKICAGCHVPRVLFEQNLDYRDYRHRDNMACSFCHSMTEVYVNPDDNRRARYTLTPPVKHLRMFLSDGAEQIPSSVEAMAIRLSPLSHGREFSRPLYKQDAFCVVCHHHQILEPKATALAHPKCIDCHMQAQSEVGLEGSLRNHFFPGANLTVPYFAGVTEAAGRIDRWLAGDLVPTIPGWENRGWDTLGKVVDEPLYKRAPSFDIAMAEMAKAYERGFRKPMKSVWLPMVADASVPAVPGKDYSLRIITTNAGMEHAFPAAALDLVDAWLEIRIQDSNGLPIYSYSGLLPDGSPAPGGHRMGGHMIGLDGHIITRDRVWQIAKKVVERAVDVGRDTSDEFTFRVPENAAGTMIVQAAWLYRKLNPPFVLWAYGPGVTAPTATVAGLQTTIPIVALDVPEPSR